MVTILNSFRSAVAGAFALLSLGILVLWGVTQRYNFEFFNNVSEFELYCAESWNGKLQIRHSTNSGKTYELNRWIFWSVDEERMHSDYAEYTREWHAKQFGGSWNKEEVSVFMPHWCWAILAALIALLIKPKPKTRFAFLDLLLLTGLIAVIAGGFTLYNQSAV